MPRDARAGKNYRAPKGKLNGLLSSLYGGVGMKDGSGLSSELDPGGELGGEGNIDYGEVSGAMPVQSAPTIQQPQAEKPGFFQNLISQGRTGQSYQDFQKQVALHKYASDLEMAKLIQQMTGNKDLENLRSQNDVGINAAKSQDEIAKAVEAHRMALEQAREQAALRENLPDFESFKQSRVPLTLAQNQGLLQKQNLMNAAGATPDFMTAQVNDEYAKLTKQGLENKATEATTAKTLAGVGPARFMGVGSDTQVDPVSGTYYENKKPLILGDTETLKTKGGFSQGSFAKVPGGVNGELGSSVQQQPLTQDVIGKQPTPQPAAPFQFNLNSQGMLPFQQQSLPAAGSLEELVRRLKVSNPTLRY